jgi:energy-coupling factor transporter ATP-binding protein EcfA2
VTTAASDPKALLTALEHLHDTVREVSLPLEVSGVDEARRLRREVAGQLDDYVLPRLRRIDAPLLTVVGGSTGAGKSTLVNSIVGAQVSASGVLRPTTRAATLVCHPQDLRWYEDDRVLPSLARVTGASGDPGSLRLVPHEQVPAGLALLDAPDIDSVVTENRELAAQLLAAADLWLFVTSAARYADAVPWDMLHTARARSTSVAIILDRVPPGAEAEIAPHLAQMLQEQGLGDAPLFVVPESALVDGLLPDEAVRRLSDWLHGLASDAAARAAVVRQTLDGALQSLRPRVDALAGSADDQLAAVGTLRAAAATAYDAAADEVDAGTSSGALLRGEVLARWQEFVGTGELLRSLEARVGRLRDRIGEVLRGQPSGPAPEKELAEALETGVEALVLSAADGAAERTGDTWVADPAGAVLLAAADSDLTRSSPGLPAHAARVVRDWQGFVLELVRGEGAARRSTARALSYGVNALGLALMIVVFAHTGGLTGGEVAVAGGTSALSQKLLEAVFGDQAVRRLAARARAELHRRVVVLLEEEESRFAAALEAAGVQPEAGAQLRAAVAAVERER